MLDFQVLSPQYPTKVVQAQVCRGWPMLLLNLDFSYSSVTDPGQSRISLFDPWPHFFEGGRNTFHGHWEVGVQTCQARVNRLGSDPVAVRKNVPPGRSLDIKSISKG